MIALTACPICGAARFDPRFQIAFPVAASDWSHVWSLGQITPVPCWTMVECAGCGVHFPNPFPDRDTITQYYAEQQHVNEWEQIHYVQESPRGVMRWGEFADKLTNLLGRPGRLLEVGPAAGHLMKA